MAAPNLAKLNTSELRKLIRTAEKLIAKRQSEERRAFVTEMRELATKRGFDLNDLLKAPGKPGAPRAKRTRKAPIKPKFRHPEERSVTWSGLGPVNTMW